MTPKEKAKELVMRFRRFGLSWDNCKQCALICVDEIMETQKAWGLNPYWEEVKTEIEKL